MPCDSQVEEPGLAPEEKRRQGKDQLLRDKGYDPGKLPSDAARRDVLQVWPC